MFSRVANYAGTVELSWEHARLQAFADNWGWSTTLLAEHTLVVRATQEVVKYFGMIIDWNKSCIWTTSPKQTKQLTGIYKTLVPDCHLLCQRTATELGAQHTYRGPLRLGKLQQRLDQANARLQTLQQMPHDVQTKAHLVNTSILPQAFFDIALHPLGSNRFELMRTNIANALLGVSHSRNSPVAIAACPNLQDPEIYAVKHVLFATKRFLRRVSTEEREVYLQMVHEHSGKYMQCRGPAGTLKFFLQKLGWAAGLCLLRA